ncbi:MAG: DUF2809 domain-containing protein [Planctomycetaceae bacterium]|nr:DUF2809 domain-containing protein [Planctomycetaceae bacterium]
MPWLDSLRQTILGRLILGFGFLWSDLLCYTAGVAIGIGIDCWIFSTRGAARQSAV